MSYIYGAPSKARNLTSYIYGGIFSWGLPTEPCALGSTQPLKMSTRNSPGGEGGRCLKLTTNHPSSVERQEIRGLNLPGPPRAPGGLLREYLTIYIWTTFFIGYFAS
jgi:hypothetical protein